MKNDHISPQLKEELEKQKCLKENFTKELNASKLNVSFYESELRRVLYAITIMEETVSLLEGLK